MQMENLTVAPRSMCTVMIPEWPVLGLVSP